MRLNHRFSPIGSVHLDTGAYVFDLVDIGEPSRLTGLFTRSYHSLDTRTTLLGPGWMHNFEARIRKDASKQDAIFTGPGGFAHRFSDAWDSDGPVEANTTSAIFEKVEEGRWIVTYKGTMWTFNDVGALIRVDDPSGEWIEVRYSVRTLMDSVGPNGPELRFDVQPLGGGDRLARVVDANDAHSSVDFAFDNRGRLIRAAPLSSAARQYTYEGDSERIATIADADGAVLISVEYDDQGRVVRLQDADGLVDGEAERFVYEDLPGGSIRTTVTYPSSRVEPEWNPVQIMTHDAQHRVIEERLQPTSSQTFIGRYAYDDEDRQIALDAPCPIQPAVPPTGVLTGPAAALSVLFYQVLLVFTVLLELLLESNILPIWT